MNSAIYFILFCSVGCDTTCHLPSYSNSQYSLCLRIPKSGSGTKCKTVRQEWIVTDIQLLRKHLKKRTSTSNVEITVLLRKSAICSPMKLYPRTTWYVLAFLSGLVQECSINSPYHIECCYLMFILHTSFKIEGNPFS